MHAQPARRPRLVSTTRPSPLVDPIAVFTNASTPRRALWLRPDTRQAFVGIGAAHTLEAHGPDRLASIVDQWHALLDSTDASGPLGPRLLGGFSFDPRRPRTALWRDFPDARFVLPERALTVSDGAAWLTTNRVAEPEAEVAAHVDAAEPFLDGPAWQQLVGRVASGIRDGSLGVDKLVLARAQAMTPLSFDVASVIRGLAEAYPTCTIFAIQHGGATFVGATPERLVALHNGTASTMALAASVSRGATPEDDQRLADQLLRNPKERAEHAVVVRVLRDALASDGLCSTVVADAEPRIRKLANVQHLFTPIRGQVAPGRSVLDLVERLHPSPAVGGHPTALAQQHLRALEGLDRGWYAAPLGWIDAHGEGEFVVGIRSALLCDGHATLFAGCGIMGDSDPAAELAESEWKLRAMREALET